MAKELEKKNSLYIEQPATAAEATVENGDASKNFDDDGRPKRTGTLLTGSAHIITAVIGSGVLSLAWAIAQLGWVAGPAALVAFSFITYFTSTFLADSYRHHGRRNYTYMDVVRSHLGGYKVQLCGLAQYGNLVGVTIGYTITASISMVAVMRSNCFHKNGHDAKCSISNYPFMAIFGGIQLILSQIPNFAELSWLSIVAAVMSFAYSSIGLGLSIAKLAGGGGHVERNLTGTRVGVDVTGSDKVWKTFQAIGDIAFAYAYSTVLIEIQMGYACIKVYYGGRWIESRYDGGSEREFVMSDDQFTLFNLRYNISQCCGLEGLDYDVFYFTSGRGIKSILRTDDEVVELCSSSFSPTLFVCLKNGASSSHAGASSSYIPTFDPSYHAEGYFQFGNCDGRNTENLHSQLDDIIRTCTSTDWDENVFPVYNLDASSSHRSLNIREDDVPDLNATVQTEEDPVDEETLWDFDDDDTDEGDYDPQNDISSGDSDRSNLYSGNRQMSRALFAEWTAWIREEGGFNRLLGMMYPDLHGQRQPPVDTDTDHMRNWMNPVVPIRPRDSAVFNEEDLHIVALGKNSYFKSKADLNAAVGLWQMESKKDFKVRKSDKSKQVLKCKVDTKCRFHIRAIAENDNWVITRFTPEHTCQADGISTVHTRNIRSRVVGAYFAKKIIRNSEIMKPKVIQNELLTSFGIKASYDICLRGRNHAVEIIYGKYADSFQDLPGYLNALETSNVGTFTKLDIDDDGRFRQVFVALAASIAAYTAGYIRPVIAVDGTHLKGKNSGVMFVAVAKDSNEQLFPLAYGIGPIENHDSWTWFMNGLRSAYGELSGSLIVSDQHVSISHAISEVFPQAFHGLCYYHLSKKMKFGLVVGAMFQRAAYTYDHNEFNRLMESMRNTNSAAYQKAMDFVPAKWARCMCPVRRFSSLTSNAAESFNNSLLWARRLPICACLDAARLVIEEWFSERRIKCRDDTHPVTEEARRKILVQLERSHTYTATRISLDVPHFKVQTEQHVYHVDLQNMLCECFRWQFDCLPCAHSIAAMTENGQAVDQYVAHYYRRDTYAKIYGRQIFGVPRKHNWTLPSHYANVQILPNVRIRLPGRPKEKRHQARGERRRRGPRTCSNCGQEHGAGQGCEIESD